MTDRKKSRITVKKLKSFFPGNRIWKIICLLVTVGILCISQGMVTYASESNEPGSTDDNRTTVHEPGWAEEPEDLMEQNH